MMGHSVKRKHAWRHTRFLQSILYSCRNMEPPRWMATNLLLAEALIEEELRVDYRFADSHVLLQQKYPLRREGHVWESILRIKDAVEAHAFLRMKATTVRSDEKPSASTSSSSRPQSSTSSSAKPQSSTSSSAKPQSSTSSSAKPQSNREKYKQKNGVSKPKGGKNRAWYQAHYGTKRAP